MTSAGSELARTYSEWPVVTAVALGGILGAEARYGLATLDRHTAQEFPWSTLVTNLIGCFLIGVLMAVLLDVLPAPHRLLRPLLGVGVLGGFTTFSTFSLDAVRLVRAHCPWLAVAYVLASVIGCLTAVTVAGPLTRRVLGPTAR